MNTSHQHKTALTIQDQALGQRRYLWFTRINAISFACLADSIVILYALKNGANEFVIGLLSSFFYLTMPFMLVGKSLVSRIGAARTYGLVWVFRKMSASLLLFVPLAIHRWGTKIGIGLLVLSIFGFYSFRSMGLTANTPILGEITDKQTRGRYLATVWMYFNLLLLITVLCLIIIFNFGASIPVFQGIIAWGIVAGLVASYLIYRVPESDSPRESAMKPIREAFAYTIGNHRARRLLMAWTASSAAIVLIVPFSMVALKKGYLVSDRNALFFAMIQILGSVLISFFNRMVLDRVGPRPMALIYSSGFVFLCIAWIIAPAALFLMYPALIFLFIGICRSGTETSMSHYFLTVIPDEERVGANMFMYMISGLFAGLTGTVLGGGLLSLLRHFDLGNFYIYRVYFLVILVACIPIILTIRRLESVADWHIRDTLSIFFSFRDIRALFTLQRLERELNLEEESYGVEKLRQLSSGLSEQKLLAYLDSPRFIVRGKALQTFQQIRFGSQAAQRIIQELEEGEFTTAYIAADIIGNRNLREGIPALRRSLQSADLYLLGKSMLALARLKDHVSYPVIESLFLKTDNPRLIIHGARAIVEMGDVVRLRILLDKIAAENLQAKVLDEVLYCVCELCNCDNEFYKLMKTSKAGSQAAIQTFNEIISTWLSSESSFRTALENHSALMESQDGRFCAASVEFIKAYTHNSDNLIHRTIYTYLHEVELHVHDMATIFALLLIVARNAVDE